MSELRKVIFAMFTGIVHMKNNAQHVFFIVLGNDNLLSISLKLGHDIYLFFPWDNSSINFNQLWILKILRSM